MKNIFLVSVATGYGGAERSLELIVSNVPSDVRVWVFAGHAEHLARLEQGGLPVNVSLIRIGEIHSLLGRRRAALRLLRACWRHRPEAILLNTHGSALLAAMAARWMPTLGRRCSLYVRDFQWTDLNYIFTRLRGCAVIVPNESVAARAGYLNPWYLGSSGKHSCVVVPDMVQTLPGAVGDQGYFLHLATINPWKGHVDLIMAAGQLADEGDAVTLRSFGLVADQSLRERLVELVSRLGLQAQVTLMDYQADPLEALQRCRAVVVPSVSHSGGPESFGRCIIEAWACGKPVIAYAAGGPARLIRDEVDGLLVKEGDIAGLAEAMRRLHQDAALSSRLGAAGRLRAEDYAASRVVPRLFDHLLSRSAEGELAR